jgi:hypothetical protein
MPKSENQFKFRTLDEAWWKPDSTTSPTWKVPSCSDGENSVGSMKTMMVP